MTGMEEIEVKFLNVDPDKLENILKTVGAQRVGEYFYRRRVFDYPDWRLDKKGAWIRLRDEGDRITLSYKERLEIKAHDGSASDGGMKEIEVEVEDFERAADLLLAIGFVEKFYQENKRIRWIKDKIEFDIDFWPMLNPYLEIEAPSWEQIDQAIALLNLNPADKKIFSTHQIYKLNQINEHDYQRMTFQEMTLRK